MYSNVKSFSLLMKDFYRADQGEDETIPSFGTRIEGLLSQIGDRFPNQLPHQGGPEALQGLPVPWE